MNRLLNPFVAVMTGILGLAYAYLAWRLASGVGARLLLALPFLLIWIVPVLYWIGDRDSGSRLDDALHFASYACMGWLNFVVLLALARDTLQLATAWLAPLSAVHTLVRDLGSPLVLGGSFAALALGALAALRGPHVRRVDIPIEGLPEALDGLRIVQISDLHVGPTIRRGYVRRVVQMANALRPDLVALTGDFVDGSVERLAPHVEPLAQLSPKGRVYFVTGNHEYYSGARAWIVHFEALGFRVLQNEHESITLHGARVVVGGVLDPAARVFGQRPDPQRAAARDEGKALRLLLAHNPKLAAQAEAAGFDLQLSGHTHAGQFFPWTRAVHLVHAPHVAGLSRAGRMWVYVSAGTGTWGPPVRFGSEPELTLLRLTRAAPAGP